MSAALVLVAELAARGIEVSTDGQDLLVRPSSWLTAADREALRGLKDQVVAALQPREVRPVLPRDFPWPDSLPGLGPRTVGAFSRCAHCVPGEYASRPITSVRLEQWGESGTWACYGSTPLCLRHAVEAEEVRG